MICEDAALHGDKPIVGLIFGGDEALIRPIRVHLTILIAEQHPFDTVPLVALELIPWRIRNPCGIFVPHSDAAFDLCFLKRYEIWPPRAEGHGRPCPRCGRLCEREAARGWGGDNTHGRTGARCEPGEATTCTLNVAYGMGETGLPSAAFSAST